MCSQHKIVLDKCVGNIYNNVEDTKERSSHTITKEVQSLTEEDKNNIETLVDILKRLPEQDKRVLEAYARGVVDKTEVIQKGGEPDDGSRQSQD